jgi:hypothetical protein
LLAILLLNGRTLVASVLALAGFGKLLRPHAAVAKERFLRSAFGARRTVMLLVGVGLVEVVTAASIVFVPLQAVIVAAGTAALAGVLTIYGVFDVRATGSCGCFGVRHPISVRALLLRNSVLFAIALAGVAAGPRIEPDDAGNAAASLGFTPLILTALAIAYRIAMLRRRSAGEWRGITGRFQEAA